MIQNCPNCGNIVEGKEKHSFARRLTGKVIEKGGLKAAATAASFVVGGPLATAATTVAEVRYGDQIDKSVKQVEEKLFTDETNDFEFCCPACNHTWIVKGKLIDQQCIDSVKNRFTELKSKATPSLFKKLTKK